MIHLHGVGRFEVAKSLSTYIISGFKIWHSQLQENWACVCVCVCKRDTYLPTDLLLFKLDLEGCIHLNVGDRTA